MYKGYLPTIGYVPPRLLTLGNAISGVHNRIGMSRLPRPDIAAGMMKKNIISMAWISTHHVYLRAYDRYHEPLWYVHTLGI